MIRSSCTLIAICLVFVVLGVCLFIRKSMHADYPGRPAEAVLRVEIVPFAKAFDGGPFDYFDRNVMLGLQSREIAISSNELPKDIDRVARAAKWRFRSINVGPYSKTYRYCKGRMSFNAELVSGGNEYWQYGIYWESDSAGDSYCSSETKSTHNSPPSPTAWMRGSPSNTSTTGLPASPMRHWRVVTWPASGTTP